MNQGDNILKLCRSMQQLNSEIAGLIRTADKMMLDKGYQHEGGLRITSDNSDALDAPQRWTPLWMYRIYLKKQDRDDVIILNIVLDNPAEPELFQEALVLCARFQYRKGEAENCKGRWDPWDLWLYKAANALNRVYGKTQLLVAPPFCAESGWAEQAIQAMQEIYFIAVPLANLVDSKVLNQKVLQPIISNGHPA